MPAENYFLLCQRPPGRAKPGCSVHAIPGMPQSAKTLRSPRIEAAAIEVEKSIELGPVRAMVLGIDMPDKRTSGPLRPDKGILTADEVDVAGPQQFVVALLRKKRNETDFQRPRVPAGRWPHASHTSLLQQPGEAIGRPPGRAWRCDQGRCVRRARDAQQLAQRRSGVGEHGNDGRPGRRRLKTQIAPQPGRRFTIERRPSLRQPALAQQPARALPEPREEKVPLDSKPRMR